MKSSTRLAVGICLGLSSAPARGSAQLLSNPAQWYINNQIYSTRVFNGTIATSMASRAAGTPREPAPAVRDVTAFQATPASTLPATLASRSSATSQGRREAQSLFEGYLALYHTTARKDRFPANDLAYAYEYFVVNNYQLYHDLIELPPDRDPFLRRATDGFGRIELLARKRQLQVAPSEEQAIYAQFRQRLAASPEVQRMTDAQKQEAAETMAIAFGINYGSYMNGINTRNDAVTAQARQMAREGLERLLGRPVESIRIGPNGLEP